MNLRTMLLIAGFLLLAAYGVQPRPASSQQATVGRCVVNVPSQWGEFKGAAQGYGLIFQDNAGTLRFMSQMPCGLEGAPVVSLEVFRR